jgi:hypothetical protein
MKLYRKISVDYSYEDEVERKKEKKKENEKTSQKAFQSFSSSSSELQPSLSSSSLETQQQEQQKSKFEVSFVKQFTLEPPVTAPVPSSLVISLTPRVSSSSSSASASSTTALSSPHPSLSTVIDSLDKFYNSGKILSFLSTVIQKIPSFLRDRPNNELPPSLAAIGSMSFDSLFSHLLSLRTEYITRLARPLLNKLYHHPKNNGIFNKPVDYITLVIPSYPLKIKKPMDLGTVRSILHAGGYETIDR